MPASATVFDKKCNLYLSLQQALTILSGGTQKGSFYVWLVLVICLVIWGSLYGIAGTSGQHILQVMDFSLWPFCGSFSGWGGFLSPPPLPKQVFFYQAEWKPKSPDRFGEIAELIKAVDSLKVEETKPQGQGSTSRKIVSANPPAQKPAAYRPPHAKNAAAVQEEVYLYD